MSKTEELQQLATNGHAEPDETKPGRLQCTKCGRFPRGATIVEQPDGTLKHVIKTEYGAPACDGLIEPSDAPPKRAQTPRQGPTRRRATIAPATRPRAAKAENGA